MNSEQRIRAAREGLPSPSSLMLSPTDATPAEATIAHLEASVALLWETLAKTGADIDDLRKRLDSY